MKVIASASTDAKVEYMRSLGAHIPFDHKTESIPSVLAKTGPLDTYWDNVGAKHSSTRSTTQRSIPGLWYTASLLEIIQGYTLTFIIHMQICGSISGYNIPREQRHGIKVRGIEPLKLSR